jgi:hypothetical protein
VANDGNTTVVLSVAAAGTGQLRGSPPTARRTQRSGPPGAGRCPAPSPGPASTSARTAATTPPVPTAPAPAARWRWSA